MNYKILLVDDDKENLKINRDLLSAVGYKVSLACDGNEAIESVKATKKDFAVILMDYHMPGMTGAEAVEAIKKIKPYQQILAFSMDDTREVMRKTFKSGVVDFIDKNAENEILLSSIASYCSKYDDLYRAIDRSDLESNERSALIREHKMVGQSQSLYNLCKEIEKIAPTLATTLILGESGTGKELVAAALHNASDRRNGPFISLNVAAEPANLLDSSLFGHKKGSFTGAAQDQRGKFQLADKGTIFLDEIGDLSLDLQVKLLRVLQEKEINPIGATRPVSVDVRIIAATHKDLKKMVLEGSFREDLYYRLSNIVIETTPLRERPDDIEPMVAHFTEDICRENGFSKRFQRRCLEVFRSYHWKGNVRELRSVIERHLIRSDSDLISAEELDAQLFEKSNHAAPVTLEDIDKHTEEIKKQFVIKVINESGSRAEASRRLGVAQNRLHYFLTKWGLVNAEEPKARL